MILHGSYDSDKNSRMEDKGRSEVNVHVHASGNSISMVIGSSVVGIQRTVKTAQRYGTTQCMHCAYPKCYDSCRAAQIRLKVPGKKDQHMIPPFWFVPSFETMKDRHAAAQSSS